ncbi:MAG: lactonase family protein, partial [Pirellulaceae bacterium]|nr:lactonase family protein [Pirellulaceae bacterium]
DHALHVLVKQADESYLPLQTFREGEAGLRGMKGANGVAVSPAGDYVYVTAGLSDSLVVFRLNGDNGMFEFAQIIRNGASTTLGLKSPNSVAVDPQSGRVFVGSSAAAGQNGGVASFTFGIYEAGVDTLIYDGGDDYQIVGGEPGTAGGLSYFDQDSSGDYTAGEDIWHDVGSQSGVYDTGDQLIYDGTDDGQNNDYQIVGGEPGTVTGLYYCDQDASGGYTAGEDIWKKGAGFAVSFSGMQQLHLSSAGGSDNIRLVAPPTNAGTTIPVTVETGEGDDSVLLSRFGSTTTVDTAGGADTVDIRVGEENTTLTVSAGDGNDRISLAGTAAGSTTTINADDGNDTVRVNGARLVSGVTVNGGAPDAPEEDVLLFDAGGGTTETSDGTIWVVGGGVVSYSNIDLTNIALPVPDAGTYDSIYEGGSVTLNGSSTVISGLTVDYAWDIDGDGIYGDRAGGTTTLEWGDLVGFGLGDDGVYQFSLRVTVTGGNEAQTVHRCLRHGHHLEHGTSVGINGRQDGRGGGRVHHQLLPRRARSRGRHDRRVVRRLGRWRGRDTAQ